jgi:hypothetical protein
VAAFGWVDAAPGRRRAWLAGGVLAAAVLVAYVPDQAGRLADGRGFAEDRSAVQRDLRELTEDPAVRAAAASCGPLYAPDPRPRPLLVYWLGLDPATVVPQAIPAGRRGLAVNYADVRTRSIFAIGSVRAAPGLAGLPPGARAVAANRSFVAATVRC